MMTSHPRTNLTFTGMWDGHREEEKWLLFYRTELAGVANHLRNIRYEVEVCGGVWRCVEVCGGSA